MSFFYGGIALFLTIAMFTTRQRMLGFPCVIFWALLGAHAYTLSEIPWGDMYFYLFFASMFGMTSFCAIAQYGLKEEKDITDREEYIDEDGGGAIDSIDKERSAIDGMSDKAVVPSSRTEALRERAKKRRTRR